jgi:hypothetical protein
MPVDGPPTGCAAALTDPTPTATLVSQMGHLRRSDRDAAGRVGLAARLESGTHSCAAGSRRRDAGRR